MSEKYENTALFLRLGLPSTLVHHENGAFQKQIREISIRWLCVLLRTENILKTKLLENDDATIIIRFFCPKFPQNTRMADHCYVFKFLRRRMVVTRMDTLKSGWTHYVYYTTRFA